jgi:8-oxo-dGTP diphosphatase
MPEYRNPKPTVDVIIQRELEVEGKAVPVEIVLIQRKNPPYGWALPGGFVDEGEPLATAARREAKEETDLDVELIEQFFSYSDPSRDPRQHTISTVFIARAAGTPRAGDDAAAVGSFALDALPELVFDHATIVADFRAYRNTGKRPPPER